jgi:hypothetical protein
MSQLVKLSKEQINFLAQGRVLDVSGQVYLNLPFWFKETSEEGVYEIYMDQSDLPKHVKVIIGKLDEMKNNPVKYPNYREYTNK